MKLLIVGGTGFIGGYTALYMRDKGHEVTIMARSRPKGESKINELPFVQGDYIKDDFNDGRLEDYDGMMFCSGSDLGVYPGDEISKRDFFEEANTIGIPRFFERAKSAGIPRTVYLSSFYPYVRPGSEDPYVISRELGDAGARKLSSPSFNVCSLGIPWILGYIKGFHLAHWAGVAKYAMGELPDYPVFAPPGGANYMSVHSVAQAVEGGLLQGESGKGYLIGDANFSWKEFFELWFNLAGHPIDIEVRDEDHFLIPREIINYVGGEMAFYDAPESERELLGYQKNMAIPAIEESFKYYSSL